MAVNNGVNDIRKIKNVDFGSIGPNGHTVTTVAKKGAKNTAA